MTIADVFARGHSLFQYPFRAIWTDAADASATPVTPDAAGAAPASEAPRCAMAVSVPKRRFKRAVKRNLIKRRSREAFRLNKQLLADKPTTVHLFLVYSADKILPYGKIEKSLCKILNHIAGNETDS